MGGKAEEEDDSHAELLSGKKKGKGTGKKKKKKKKKVNNVDLDEEIEDENPIYSVMGNPNSYY